MVMRQRGAGIVVMETNVLRRFLTDERTRREFLSIVNRRRSRD
jgi:hypothetical protein